MDNPTPYIFFALGTIALWGISHSILRKRKAATWPKTKGRITACTISSRKTNKGRISFFPKIAYQFKVHGKSYEGNDIDGGAKGHRTEGDAQSITDRYHMGCEVDVCYNPLKPDDCLLEAKISNGEYVLLLVPIAFIGVAIHLFTK
ncbi:DUF3592 domain-containing protein [bacterium]|nr:DUF3592 domain-containing protein [Akkermansiaceae bacterium]MDB4485600.1 DUF3592 domain-containing protein [bacterium]MDA7862096.1 DUF3592 domain-containing protein [Akkermansiaceae bacterium]MDB4412103.1 DUF3592 domain-containing protein [Akkermansiaceae bacterium]MDB4498942.1 DUF3592 domain-containing protein [Akkermansiaceae bacterium]